MTSAEKRFKMGRKITVRNLLINTFLTVVKFSVGFLANSSAMIADGFHSLSDIFSSAVVLIGLKISIKPADGKHPYGHGKAESVVAKIIALLLTAAGFMLIYHAIKIIIGNELAVPGWLALGGAVISVFVKELMYRLTFNVGKKINSTALKADAWHHRSDALSSVAALIGIFGARLGFPFLDPVAAVFVGGMVIRVGIKLLTKAINELMDSAPDEETLLEIKTIIQNIAQVQKINDLKIRQNGPYLFVDLKVVVAEGLSALEAHNISANIKTQIINNDQRVKDVLVHVDPAEIEKTNNFQ